MPIPTEFPAALRAFALCSALSFSGCASPAAAPPPPPTQSVRVIEPVTVPAPAPTPEVSGAPDASEPVPVHSGATLFEDTRFGMSDAELERVYGKERVRHSDTKRFPGKHEPFLVRRTIEKVTVEVSFIRREAGLAMVELSGVREYEYADDCAIELSTLATWISERAGNPTRRDSFDTAWDTPTAHIVLFCDQDDLGGYYEPPEK